jgi:hypothetical protein
MRGKTSRREAVKLAAATGLGLSYRRLSPTLREHTVSPPQI